MLRKAETMKKFILILKDRNDNTNHPVFDTAIDAVIYAMANGIEGTIRELTETEQKKVINL